MKRLLLLVTAVCLTTFSMTAQTSLVATLTHVGETTEYYGQDALVNAVAASADGDLITLSAGLFNGTTINKSLTIRGNGAEPAEEATQVITKVVLEKSADPDDANHWLNIEGIYFNCEVSIQRPTTKTDLNILKDLCMKKCKVKSFSSLEYYPNGAYYGTLKNSSFVHCRFLESFTVYNVSEVSFINSIVVGYSFGRGTGDQVNNPKVHMYNSVAVFNKAPDAIGYLSATNSVLVVKGSTKDTSYPFPSTFSSTNCLITGYLADESKADAMYTKYTPVATQWMPMTEVFATLTNYTSFEPTDDYALTPAAQAFLGTDGTQVGIYGGAMPYTSTVSYPRFTTFSVAGQAVDGTLAVEIAAE